jgi:AcrR family transcriptional regulator
MMARDRRQELLEAAIEHVAVSGLTDLSLRGLAARLGTSHRMLSHHFGSKEGLWVAIVEEVERRQIAAMAEMAPDPSLGLEDVLRARWRVISDPALWPNERLFFEVYARALRGAPGTAGFLDDIVESWVAPAAELAESRGVPHEDARAFARLGVAVVRGLLLDLLATGDRAGVDAAMEAWITSASPLLERQAFER